MLQHEGLNDITEDPTSEWGDDVYFDEDDDIDDELDLKVNNDLTARNSSSRPETTKSSGSQLRSDSKRVRLKHSRPPILGFSATNLKRDPAIEAILESRKSSVLENVYTNLAQTTSQRLRSSLPVHIHSLKPRSILAETDNAVTLNDIKAAKNHFQNLKRLPSTSTVQFDNERWEDGLTSEFDKESIASIDKSSLQVYEETCKRLNICSCSMIVRSLYTTKINLRNYGLGPKGCAALAVALVRNTTVLSLDLSGNNIGNDGMSHIYQILTENTYVEEYNLSYNNLGTKGIRKLAAAVSICVQLKTLSVAGNELTASDIIILLSKLDDHENLKDLSLKHNQLDEEGGIYVAKWLSDNNVLLHLDISWCSIRLLGARALAKAIGDNNKLLSLDLSNNSFTNDTIEYLTNSLTRNMILCDLNLSGNQIFCRYDKKIPDDPSILIIGKEAIVYKMLVAAATNQALKIFRLGKNHIDARCIMFMLEALSKLDSISLEELDLTGFTVNTNQIADIHKLFANHSKFTCYVGPIRQTVEHFTNNLLNLIHRYCRENEVSVIDLFTPDDENSLLIQTVTYDQFCDGLRKAKIPFPIAQIGNMMKYLGRENDNGMISLRF